MKHILLILFSTCIFHVSIAQAESEYMSMFFRDLTKILFSVDKKTTPKLTFKARIYLDNKPKVYRTINVACTFLNDSIVKQKLDGQTFYGLMKNGVVREYDIKQQKLETYDRMSTRDSSDCLVTVSYNIQNHKDTTTHYTINKRTSDGKLIYSVSTRIEPGGKDMEKTVWTNDSDTLYKTSEYRFIGSEWVHLSDRFQHRKTSADHKSCTEYITKTTEKEFKSEKLDTDYHYTIQSFYTFDEQGRIIGIEKYEYSDGTKNWNEKNVISVSYN